MERERDRERGGGGRGGRSARGRAAGSSLLPASSQIRPSAFLFIISPPFFFSFLLFCGLKGAPTPHTFGDRIPFTRFLQSCFFPVFFDESSFGVFLMEHGDTDSVLQRRVFANRSDHHPHLQRAVERSGEPHLPAALHVSNGTDRGEKRSRGAASRCLGV